ncbi:steroid 5-alpha reductase [Brasilonema sp. CT11]|nr:steroid 5-alpha reductase [Brasilonema sp. CT11]
MHNTTKEEKIGLIALTAINVAKVFSIACLVGFIVVFGIQDWRQVIYLCLHISYLLWWLVEQWFFPLRREQIFNQPVGVGELIFGLLFTGAFYVLPGYLAFTNSIPLSMTAAVVALPLYIFGRLVNDCADVQQMTAKQNINYLGDWLRYLSFAVLAGSLWAYLVPGAIALVYFQRISQKEQAMSAKYPDYAEYRQSTARLIPFVW